MTYLLANCVSALAAIGVAEGVPAPEVQVPRPVPADRTCDSTYSGPPDGVWQLSVNWTNGIPNTSQLACFPEAASALAEKWQGKARVLARWTLGESMVATSGPAPDPPPPTTPGVCCLGSTCVQSDYFDCLSMDGYFRSDVLTCDFNPCVTGVCCDGDPPECLDEDLGGDPIDEELCQLTGGQYLGGAACDATDPCQRFRIPEGFEIVEVTSGDVFLYPPLRMNNCGEIAFTHDFAWKETGEVLVFDNGLITPVTDDLEPDGLPDLNDMGTLVWTGGFDSENGGSVVLGTGGEERVLGVGEVPSINERAHVAWQLPAAATCDPSEFKSDIYFYDGRSSKKIYDDGYSNQSARINDDDSIAWTHYLFPCGGGSSDWTSDIFVQSNGELTTPPPATEAPGQGPTPQSPALNNLGLGAWSGSLGLEFWDTDNDPMLLVENGAIPDMTDEVFIAYQFKTDFTPWQVFRYHDGKITRITNDADIEAVMDNARADINEYEEMGWWRSPNGGLTPSSIHMMRRIRNSDVTFDGVVDIDDFIPLPGCWTGPVVTDGLCECRFYDIDHDRDIDDDDFALFMRVYQGPQEDCNTNGVLDLTDLIEGTSADCNLNGIPDLCDIASGTSTDADSDGNLDECCAVAPTVSTDTLGARNRYLTVITDPRVSQPTPPEGFTFIRHAPPVSYALRVTVKDMPPGLEEYEGTTLWAGAPREICENSGQGLSVPPDQCGPAPGPNDRTMWVARLVCGEAQAHYTDWSELGTVHLYHQTVVPEGSYSVQSILAGCGTTFAGNYSAALPLTQARWGDVVSDVTQCPMGPPNNDTDVLGDVVSLVQKFSNLPCAPTKARADLEPGSVDFVINFTDVLEALQAFTGAGYPFTPSVGPCS